MSNKTLTLKIFRADELVDTKTLTQDVIKIGKLKSSHLCLEDEAVARMHAVIEVSGSDVRVIDLGSSAGTVLNGAPIDKNASIAKGDVLTFGPYRVEISEIADAAAVAPAPAAQAPVAAPAAGAAAPVAMAAPMAAAAAAPPVQIDVGSVEVQDGRQVAEVVAMYGRTALDVAHVGQVKSRKAMAPVLIGVGGVLMLAGLGLFAYEVNQPWEDYSSELRAAKQAKKPDPPKPGAGTGALGIMLALMGTIPMVAGAMRLGEKSVIDYTIGEGHNAVFHVPPHGLPDAVAFPLVRSSGGEFALNFTKDMTGEVTLDGQTLSLQDLVASGRAGGAGSYYSFPLPRGVQGKVNYEDITFHVNTVNPGAVVAGRGDTDWPFWAYVGGTAVIGITFYLLMRSIPDDLLAISMDDGEGEPAYARFMHQPDETKEEEPPPEEQDNSDDEAGGTGQRHKGEEGKMGKPSSKSKSGLYAMKGPQNAVPQMARNFDPDMAARNAGILGVMQQQGGHFLASPYGGAFAVGNDDEDVWGGLTGTEVGEAYGVGGLGLVGTGRGGGGTGEGTIGLGNTGLIGKGGGGGTGSGYGRGSGAGFGGRGKRVPQVRQAKADVQGALDKDIIRRIVRAHINEVRSCYNAGLTKDPNLQGRVAVNFVITGTGMVASAVVQESTIKDASVGNCIAKAVKRWKFPKPRGGGNVIVTYPFNLSPG
ncbi:MAG: AgmX/PglI C-terminal domain-containing protein [Myxococcales bacterium]|nr:AgmX/PglI C-terminal domain-containing protein [Myxococcales bacterium]